MYFHSERAVRPSVIKSDVPSLGNYVGKQVGKKIDSKIGRSVGVSRSIMLRATFCSHL